MTATAAPAATGDLARAFRDDERFLWGLCYRMTGSKADADDAVQETFRRALASPPADTSQPWRPWLVRVAVNVARDALRARKRRRYFGPWLPEPVEDDVLDAAVEGPESRYGTLESASYAFLVALEALTPRQRAVLVLRDVVDLSVEETAVALAMTATNVKVTHHRARTVMARYDRSRVAPDAASRARTRAALEAFLAALLAGDATGLAKLVRDDVVAATDAGGSYHAAVVNVRGAARVITTFVNVTELAAGGRLVSARIASVNGLPALVYERVPSSDKLAPRMVLRVDVDEAGAIRALHSVLAPAKLGGVRF